MPLPENLVIPMKLDAFVFNESVCNATSVQAKIAPITQPNYTFLRLRDHLAQNDILDHVDLHNSTPAGRNPRFTDVGKGSTRTNRVGVYVHWSLPRPLRSGTTSTPTAAPRDSRNGTGNDPQGAGPNAPRYHSLPNRWLVIRTLDPEATEPKNVMEPVKAWGIESDKVQNINSIPESTDLQVDVAPFITSFNEQKKTAGQMDVDQQAEIFIGQCMDASKWKEQPSDPKEQRVGLSAASSSNQLFMDYQYHNGNVFSMLDTFTYERDGQQKALLSAKANYYVLGWRDEKDKDLLSEDKNLRRGTEPTAQSRRKRIEDLHMTLDETVPAADKKIIDEWLKDNASARSLCHGAIYDVEWNVGFRPEKIPADDYGFTLASDRSIAVGTTPINSILAYIAGSDPNTEIEDSIYQLQALLRAEDDSIDAYMAAADEVQCIHYAHFDGGTQFARAGTTGGKPNAQDDQDHWATVNSAQKLKDATLRRTQQLRWELFGWWWKYISDVDNVNNGRTSWYQAQVEEPKEELKLLEKFLDKLDPVIGQPQPPTKSVVMEDFHQRGDPTLLLAGCDSGWPKDFNNVLKVRLDNQLLGDLSKTLPKGCSIDCVPEELRKSASNLVNEFLELATKSNGADPKPKDALLPLYHDGMTPSEDVSADNPWRDRWGSSQPWFPLYLEWDAEYTHISPDAWSLIQRSGRWRSHIAPKISYVLNRDVRNPEKKDVRSVSGRSLLLPQPSFSLKIHLERLFSTVPEPQLDKALSKERRIKLLSNVDKLGFLSVPLDGLTEHLTTLYKGSHIKPLVRPPGEAPILLDEAAAIGLEIGLSKTEMAMIGQESDPTPYGSLASLVGVETNAFKPVTHGQLRFTKLNVVDKFGQVCHAIDPVPELPAAIHPHVSEEYAIDAVPSNPEEPNVVDPNPNRSTLEEPEFIQLPPSINQPARINAHFVVHGEGKDHQPYWKPISDWDNPIWGWVVVNYANLGLQFFLQDGTFYREVCMTSGTASGLKWLPFDPKRATSQSMKQLDWLIDKMTESRDYLGAFMDMIMTALSATTPAPTAYAQFLNSLVGKPLALANMGWSLELNTKSKTNQSTIDHQRSSILEWGLLGNEGRKQYEFPIKLGDKARNYDGLIGYFDTPRGPEGNPVPSDPQNQNDLVLDGIYTYYHEKSLLDDKPLKEINERSYPRLKCFWNDPKDYAELDGQPIEKIAAKHERDRHAKLQVYGAIFDPFSPITGFSSILPIRTLKLPTWTWESALKKMTTFFHAGPTLLTEDVPNFEKSKELSGGNYMKKFTANGQICSPAMNVADWAWLQPYDLNTIQGDISYVGLEIGGQIDQRPRWVNGPMTAVEGFMQLRAPLEQELKTPS